MRDHFLERKIRDRKIESRLEAVEKNIAELKGLVRSSPGLGLWYERIVGSMKDYSEFAEVVRLGREMRKSEHGLQEPTA
jgi:hypothetical protein